MPQSKEEKNRKERLRYWENRDKIRIQHAIWHANNRDKVKARKQKWHKLSYVIMKRREADKVKYRIDPIKKLMNNRRLRYGVDASRFQEMFQEQEGQCAICKKSINIKSPVDHCHKTGAVRGILCAKCNTGLGMFEDDIVLLETVIKYLKGK